jgi:hypothetical protein
MMTTAKISHNESTVDDKKSTDDKNTIHIHEERGR